MIRRILFICLCALAGAAAGHAQVGSKPKEQPAPPPPMPGTTGRPAPPMPKVDTTPSPFDSSDGAFSIAPYYWFENGKPQMRTGRGATSTTPSDLDFPGKGKDIPGIIVSAPAGKDNTLRFSYFRFQGSGSLTSDKDLRFFGTAYDKGTALSPKYTMQNVKVSLDYTSWPFPLKTSHFRLKTLWEIQYTSFQSIIHAPDLEAADATLNPAKKSDWFLYPTFGLGIEESLSKHLRFEAKASGFAFPRRAVIWDADAQLAYRMGPVEIFGGGKGFHFKTSPQREEYIKGTLTGAFVGIRWYPKF